MIDEGDGDDEATGSGEGEGSSDWRDITAPPVRDSARAWEHFPSPDVRNRLAEAEGTADNPDFGYGEVNRRSGALGRYQMLPDALRAAGMLDAPGNWTGKYGIRSAAQFLASPKRRRGR